MIQKHRYYDNAGNFIQEIEEEVPDVTPIEPEPTQLDRVEAQVTYTAMMTDTLLEE